MMPKTKKLKANLKAADKRRKRRASDSARTETNTTFSAESKLDVEGLITEGVLTAAAKRESRREPNLRDSAVIAALKALKHGTKPNSKEATSTHNQICLVLDHAGVQESLRVTSATQMLSLAKTYSDGSSPDQFIRYLSLIAV